MPTKFEDQVAHFTSMFPGGFGDPLYLYQERDFVSAKGLPRHKTEASQLAQRLLAEDALDSLIAAGGAGLYAALRKIAAPVSILLSRFEAARFADQLKDADAELAIAVGLRELLYGAGPVASRFDAFAGKWRPDCARSWPILTLFPALGQPMEFVFVKPTYSRTQAAAIGRPIAVSGPLGKHYEEFLAVARDVRERLEQAHIPQRHDGFDLLDVYSFTLRSLIGKGYVGRSTLAPLRTYRAARTRGILLAPGAVLEPGAGEWKVLGTDGSARTVSLPHDRGALVARGDCVAIFATSQSQYPGPSWLSWPELESVAPGPDAAVCDEVVEFAAAADRVAWLGPESNGSQGDQLVLKVASSFLYALPHAAEDRILIAHSVGIAARVVLDPSGRHAVIACAGAGVVLVDIEKRMSVSVSLPSGGHPVWCAVHPEHPLAAVFARNLQVIEFSKKKPVVYTSTFSSNTKLGGEFTPDGKWLLFADTDRIYGMNVRSRIIRTISTGAGGTENQPLRLSFDGRSALIEREGAVVEFDVDALVAEIAAGPEVGRCYKLAEATADNE